MGCPADLAILGCGFAGLGVLGFYLNAPCARLERDRSKYLGLGFDGRVVSSSELTAL